MRARQKIIKISYWKGAESGNLNRLAKGDAGARGHDAQGLKVAVCNDSAAHMPEHLQLPSPSA